MQKSAILVALGGNAISRSGEEGTIVQQFGHTRETMEEIARGVAGRYRRLLITHGNGPQIGSIILRSELAAPEIYPLPLDTCVSDSEGGMGYMIQQIMQNVLRKWHDEPGAKTEWRLRDKCVVCVLTQVRVDPQDPMWSNPTKFIGRFYTMAEADKLKDERKWQMREDSGRGWRRVVPSPDPAEIIEIDAIRALLESGVIVIAAGGGGIPVVRDPDGDIHGVEAVIDKDLASALLARTLGIGTFAILTGVEQVAIDYGKPSQQFLKRLTAAEARRYLSEGQFPAGSMGPKIQAALNYLQDGGGRVIITSPESFSAALEGNAGTEIIP